MSTEETQKAENPEDQGQKKPIWKILLNKYVLGVIIFLAWITFFDENNLIQQSKKRNELNKMLEKKAYYETEIKKNEEATDELLYDRDQLEAYGREKYLMKRDNEDIYLIIENED